MRARDIMTGSLITCAPDDSVAEAAKLMRDRNTGDVLVTDDGRLLGIVTDRDIAVRAAASGRDPTELPVRSSMSKHPVTGKPEWNLDQVAKTMSKHQIRRLPIVENGMLVGIISLGDLALRNNQRKQVAHSLKNISEPGAVHRMRRVRGLGIKTLALAVLAGAVIAFTMYPKSVSMLKERVQDSGIPDRLTDAYGRVQDSGIPDRLTQVYARGRDMLSDLAG